MRLIDADALMKTLGITDMDCVKCAWYSRAYRQCKRGGDFEDACTAIEDAPTVEPQRMRGKWIDQNGGGCCCSECGRYALDEPDGNFIHVAVKSNYCPNCGADMRGGQND